MYVSWYLLVSLVSDMMRQCSQGACCDIVGVNTIAPSSNNTGEGGECMPGYYCPEGSARPISCPPGDYRYVSVRARFKRVCVCVKGRGGYCSIDL